MAFSKNQLTGENHLIPENLCDREAIDAFTENNKNKPVVCVQGLGFVGAVMSLVCANARNEDYAVIGVDRATEDAFWRIQSLNDGLFPLTAEDPKIKEFFENSKTKENFHATFDPYAYSLADVIIVDINLDVAKTTGSKGKLEAYDVDLTGFKKAIETIGKNCKENVLVLVETTVPPGTCLKVIKPILIECLKERDLTTDKFKLAHSYERVMPGPNYIDSIQNFPRVYAGMDDKSANAAEQFLHTIINTEECSLTRLNSPNATEMAKVLENSYRAMNIAFAVEWSRFAEEAGVDLYAMVNAIRERPTHANLMFPGIGVGGYCLTKDPLLASWSRQTLFGSDEPLTQSEMGVKINDEMPRFAFDFLKDQYEGDIKDAKVLLLGVSYRGEVGDTRSTPVDLFYECIKETGAEITLHDPYVTYWQEKDMTVSQDIKAALDTNPDIIAISTGHQLYKDPKTLDILAQKKNVFIYDTIGILPAEDIVKLREDNKVKVLGRGDL